SSNAKSSSLIMFFSNPLMFKMQRFLLQQQIRDHWVWNTGVGAGRERSFPAYVHSLHRHACCR
ncbi:MAG TPA: hypothetical protein VM871_04785, partial [Flavisolibacter sp.]|nr:hypothetical protein [Flavisolibacter sp.]